MELRRRGRWRRERVVSTAATSRALCVSICFFSVCALIAGVGSRTVYLETRDPSGGRMDSHIQGSPETGRSTSATAEMDTVRRYLVGPGSYPPRCTSKCGNCTPCRPVHVPVPPGTPVTLEYYPEAWRCKCGNKLYMP